MTPTLAGRPGGPAERIVRLLGGLGAALIVAASVATPVSAAGQDQRAFLALSINGVDQADALVVLRGADAMVAVSVLDAAGLRGLIGRREDVGGTEFVSLSSLAPRITFRIDETELRLTLTADPDLLAVVVRDLDRGAPPDMVYRSAASTFVNYAATANSALGYELFTETGMSVGGALLYTTATKNPLTTVRGLSNLTIDRRSRLQRWVVGDNFATGGPLGGDTLLAGVTVAREFGLAPYFVRQPTMSVSTPVATPSVLEVHVNGRLVREEQVQPGRLDLRNVPMVAGRNETRLVLRDPFGGTREITSGFYLSSTALARGVQDYQYSIGWRRQQLGTASWDYQAPVAIARHRLGLSDTVTAGLRLEGDRGLISGGPVLNLRLPAGEVEVAGGASRDSDRRGRAGHVSYNYAGSHVSFGALVARISREYANVSLRHGDARPEASFTAFTSVPTGGSSTLTLQHDRTTGGGPPAQSRTSLLGSARLGRSADFVASVTRIRGLDAAGTEVSASVTMTFGGRTVGSVSALNRPAGTQAVVDVQRPLPLGTGVGYQFRAETGERTAASGAAQYQGTYGRYEVRHDAAGAAPTTSASISGGLVAIGGGLHASRAVRSSYALVRVPGVEGVRAFSSNHDVGRTSRRGTVLVPDLLPYYGNRLAIADADVPLDYQVPDVQLTLALPYRGGAVALFPVQRIQRISGTVIIVTSAGERRPSYGSVAITAGMETVTSPVGAAGEFYFEDVPPGHHAAVVTDGEAACSLTIDIPAVDEPVVSLGVLRCREAGGQ